MWEHKGFLASTRLRAHINTFTSLIPGARNERLTSFVPEIGIQNKWFPNNVHPRNNSENNYNRIIYVDLLGHSINKFFEENQKREPDRKRLGPCHGEKKNRWFWARQSAGDSWQNGWIWSAGIAQKNHAEKRVDEIGGRAEECQAE